MKTRISAMICLLCVLGYADLTRAEDPYSQRVADPYALSPGLPTMSSGTLEPYLSFMAGMAIPLSADATFTDGTTADGGQGCRLSDETSQSGATRGSGFQPETSWRDSISAWKSPALFGIRTWPAVRTFIIMIPRERAINGVANSGTTTEINGIYVGANFLVRYPMAISEAYPNGRWHPYVGIGVGAHQMAMKPGGYRGEGISRAITDQRDTTIGFMGVGGIKAHLFKYVAAFVEAKYIHAHHNGLTTDRFGNSSGLKPFSGVGCTVLVVNPYSSTINTIFVHAGLSIHFDVKP